MTSFVKGEVGCYGEKADLGVGEEKICSMWWRKAGSSLGVEHNKPI